MITRRTLWAGGAALGGIGLAGPVLARGNLASKPTELERLLLNPDLSLSVKEYKVETGKYYKWNIESKGGDEYRFMAPDLFTNCWVYQVSINGIEIHDAKVFSIEFDKEGTATIFFLPIRPGRFKYWVRGHEERGMVGMMIVE